MNTQVMHDELPAHVKLPRSVRLSEGNWKRARVRAIREGRSASDVVEEALDRFLNGDSNGSDGE